MVPRVEASAIRLSAARPVDEDARLVMEWRNDPVTLAASFHGAPKTWPEFGAEFAGYFPDAPLVPQFGSCDAERIAFLRYRRCADPTATHGEVIDISINVAPMARGRGLGRAVIAAASAFALATHELVLAEIKPGNAASSRAFLAAGYSRITDGVHDVDGIPVPVERYVLRRVR
ncbi:MAG: GNAT family N-acetyltransferase [Myxococcales bacterium]|nr:GNAT family N-acetyltransferase [Myxococcales bacterium]